MLRASPLGSSAAHPRSLSASPSPLNSFKPRVLDITGVCNPLKNPRLRPLASCSRFTPRALLLVCRADHLGDAGSKIRAPSEEESMAEVEGDWARRDSAEGGGLSVEIRNPSLPASLRMHRVSLGDQAFFLLAFIACTTSIAFTSLVIAAVPTLYAMKRAATSLAKLADTAREELPSTMAAIRLSGMEISDLTLELSDLSQEIADGVNKSAQAVQAAEAGIRQFGASARRHTVSLIQERASLPNISLKPVVAGAAKRTSHAVGQATKSFINLLSRSHHSSEIEEGSSKVDY